MKLLSKMSYHRSSQWPADQIFSDLEKIFQLGNRSATNSGTERAVLMNSCSIQLWKKLPGHNFFRHTQWSVPQNICSFWKCSQLGKWSVPSELAGRKSTVFSYSRRLIVWLKSQIIVSRRHTYGNTKHYGVFKNWV